LFLRFVARGNTKCYQFLQLVCRFGGLMLFLCCTVLLVACSGENKLTAIQDPNDNSGVEIEVSPDLLQYGALRATDEAVVQQFTITSIGVDALEVEDIVVDGEQAASFTILETETSFTLYPNESRDINVAFFPMDANEVVSQALVFSNAYNAPAAEVTLHGEGIIGALDISPDPLDYGEHNIGCPNDNQLTITNVGSETVDITEIDHSGDGYTLNSLHTLPLSLAPEESISLDLNFTAMTEGNSDGELRVVSNEPMGTRVATQSGTGLIGEQITQEWVFDVNPPSDILFSVDSSCSMSDNMNQLSNNFSSFISELSNYSTDWQVMVTGGDSGCNVGGVLTPATPGYESVFQNAVMCKEDETFGAFSQNPLVGECDAISDQYSEALLTEARNAIEESDSGECNFGFIRQNAMLHIILVSDEPEQSIDITGETWQQLTDQIIAKRGSAGLIRISSIVGDVPNGCTSGGFFGSDADPGTGYVDATNYTNGVFLSICDDWSSPGNLQLLAEASVLLDSYPLDYAAMENSITVEVNGYSVDSTYWTYDSSIQSVVFTSNAPAEGSTVRITYTPMGVCE
jgi:hypothetical protein